MRSIMIVRTKQGIFVGSTFRRFLSSTPDKIGDDNTKPIIEPDRGQQAKGAMREYIKKVANKTDTNASNNLWAKLRKDIAPPVLATDSSKDSLQNNSNSFRSNPETAIDDISVNTQAPSDSLSRGRSANKRFVNKNKRPGAPGSVPGGSSSSSSDRVKPRKSSGEESGSSDYQSAKVDDIPPGIKAILLDTEYFEEYVKTGSAKINMRDMDPIDRLLATSFIESFKTKSNKYTTLLENSSFARTVLPKSRSMEYINNSLQPNIKSVPSSTVGYELASEAWGVIQQNYYFTDNEKNRLCEGIAVVRNKMEKFIEEDKDNKVDLIFQYDFRKGLEGIEEEKRLKALANDKPINENEYIQSETEWDVEAVTDEDQL